MDGIALGTPPRFRVASPCFSSSRFRRRLLSLDPAPGVPMDRPRRPCALRCTTAEEASETEEECDPPTSGGQKIANSVEIKKWQNGNVVDDAASRQGIKIRRRPLTGPPKHYVGPFEFRLENEGNTPRNILEKIIWDKDVEVSQLKERRPLTTLKKALDDAPPVRDFVGALKASVKNTGMPALIAEVKKASPSRGVLRENFDPVKIASAYEKFGATCISVLTDEKYFQGSFENLEAIRRAGVKCPLLCKEFIIDAWQIYYARSKGADAILLIAAVLPDLDIKYLTKICRLLGLATLVEVHNEREMDRVLSIEGIQLIGINNRDLAEQNEQSGYIEVISLYILELIVNLVFNTKLCSTFSGNLNQSVEDSNVIAETFEVDISNTKRLLEGERGELIRQRDIIVVGESGLFTPEDISYVQGAGVKAVLVGESLIKQDDPGKAISGLFGKDISK